MSWDPEDLVELRVRGEFVDVVGLLAEFRVVVEDGDVRERATQVGRDLTDQAAPQVNYGEAERQLKRINDRGEKREYRGIDVQVHDFDPRHPDERSELKVDRIPPLDELQSYAIVGRGEEGIHMAGYPDNLAHEESLILASALRIYARELEEMLE